MNSGTVMSKWMIRMKSVRLPRLPLVGFLSCLFILITEPQVRCLFVVLPVLCCVVLCSQGNHLKLIKTLVYSIYDSTKCFIVLSQQLEQSTAFKASKSTNMKLAIIPSY